MRILVVADIHANWRALSAINEPHDVCLCLGDLVDYGGAPIPCIDWVRHNCQAVVRGNHDHAVAQRVSSMGDRGLRKLAAATRAAHWNTLQPTHLKYLSMLPITVQLDLGGTTFYLVHATPRDPMDEYLGRDRKQWEDRLAHVQADFVCVGHTHLPFHLDLGSKQVLNPGSVGQPRDGDPRAAYAVIDNGRIELKRVEYDIDAAVDDLRQAGVNDEALAIASHVLQSGGKVPDGE